MLPSKHSAILLGNRLASPAAMPTGQISSLPPRVRRVRPGARAVTEHDLRQLRPKDDFGEHSATSRAQEKLYQLINHRYNGRLPMVVTTCLSLDEIETRVSSRMVDPTISLVFNITAPDYRGNVKPVRRARGY